MVHRGERGKSGVGVNCHLQSYLLSGKIFLNAKTVMARAVITSISKRLPHFGS